MALMRKMHSRGEAEDSTYTIAWRDALVGLLASTPGTIVWEAPLQDLHYYGVLCPGDNLEMLRLNPTKMLPRRNR